VEKPGGPARQGHENSGLTAAGRAGRRACTLIKIMDANLNNRLKLAAYGITTVLRSPRYGFSEEKTAAVVRSFRDAAVKRANRQEKLAQLLLGHLKPQAS